MKKSIAISLRIGIAVWIAAGFLLARSGQPRLLYTCEGSEVFPEYIGSPFIYKSTSLATSMAFDYYLIGFFANLIIWSGLILTIRWILMKIIRKEYPRTMLTVYRGIKYLLIGFSILVFIFEMKISGQTFTRTADLETHAANWGMQCSPAFVWW